MLHRRCFLYALAWMFLLSPIVAASQSSADTTLLPYAATDYRFMQFGAETPFPAGIETSSFDESSFGTGQAAFGSSAECADVPLSTPWDPGTKLAVRKHFQAGSSPTGVELHFGVDNDAVIFINGTQVASVTHENCARYDDFVVPIPDGVVLEGDNLIVALCVDRGTIAWFDMSVTAEDHPPSLTAPFGVNGEEGGTLSFNVTASDPDGDPIGSLTANLTSLPEGSDASFSTNEGNTEGTLLWHMMPGEAGSYDVTFTAESNDLSATATTHIAVGLAGTNIAGVFTWTTHAGDEGDYDIVFQATDDGGSTNLTTTIHVVSPILTPLPTAPLAPRAPQAPQKGPIISGPRGTTVTAGSTVTVNVTASTDLSEAAAVTLRAPRIQTAARAAQTLPTLTVDTSLLPSGNDAAFQVDHQPLVAGSSAVTLLPGTHFSQVESAADPDGDAIDFFTADLSGLPAANPGAFSDNATHTSGTLTWTPRLEDVGTYVVTFEAKNRLVGPGSVTITVAASAEARVFVSDPVKFNIGSQRGSNFVFIEPVDGSFDLTEVDLSTIRLLSPGTGTVSEIGVTPDKTSVIADRDHNLIQDVQVAFAKDDLRALFSHLTKKTLVTLQLQGQLTNGGLFGGTFQVEVIANGPAAGDASVSPNPLNPQATLSLNLGKAGSLKVTLFDAQGRLVRVLVNEASATPGRRDVTVDGKDSRGAPLASGLYYFRVESADGVHNGRLAIVR